MRWRHYCRTCGKPLCANCTRDVHGVIYCENCLADTAARRPAATVSAARGHGFVPATDSMSAGLRAESGSRGHSGRLLSLRRGSGLLRTVCQGPGAPGDFHAAGLGRDSGHDDGLATMLGLGIAFFYVYQIIDSVRTAKALQMGQPAPDPFGTGTNIQRRRDAGRDASKDPDAASLSS